MSDTERTAPAPKNATPPPQLAPCPPWCRLPSGHGWDSYHDDGSERVWHRGHSGPNFGPIYLGGQETSTRASIVLDSTLEEGTDLTPAQWRDLAAYCHLAATWLERGGVR